MPITKSRTLSNRDVWPQLCRIFNIYEPRIKRAVIGLAPADWDIIKLDIDRLPTIEPGHERVASPWDQMRCTSEIWHEIRELFNINEPMVYKLEIVVDFDKHAPLLRSRRYADNRKPEGICDS